MNCRLGSGIRRWDVLGLAAEPHYVVLNVVSNTWVKSPVLLLTEDRLQAMYLQPKAVHDDFLHQMTPCLNVTLQNCE